MLMDLLFLCSVTKTRNIFTVMMDSLSEAMKPLMLTLIITAFLFPQFFHPMILLLLLLATSLALAFFIGISLPTFWMSYVLFLVYLGGLLILFTYVITLIPNEPINKMFISPLFIPFTIIFLPLFVSPLDISMWNLTSSMTFVKKIFFLSSMNITMLLITFLLFVLIVVVSITTYKEGPLRMN